MHSSTPLRVLRARTCKQVASRRFASHGAPHYNEPSGYLFGEKVRSSIITPFVPWWFVSAPSSRTEADKGGLGEHLVYRDVWQHWACFTSFILQAGHQVGFLCWSCKFHQRRSNSIQGWALKEAKARMEARGEKVQYESWRLRPPHVLPYHQTVECTLQTIFKACLYLTLDFCEWLYSKIYDRLPKFCTQPSRHHGSWLAMLNVVFLRQ